MKNKLAIFGVVAAAAFANPASAIIDPYFGASIGTGSAFSTSSSGDGIDINSVGVQVGVDVPFVRAEAEYNYVVGDDFSANLGMINIYLEPMLPVLPILSPYLGVGAGRMFDTEISDLKFSDTSAYQVMLGTGLSLPEFPIRFDVEGRFVGTGKIKPNAFPEDKGENMGIFDIRIKANYMF